MKGLWIGLILILFASFVYALDCSYNPAQPCTDDKFCIDKAAEVCGGENKVDTANTRCNGGFPCTFCCVECRTNADCTDSVKKYCKADEGKCLPRCEIALTESCSKWNYNSDFCLSYYMNTGTTYRKCKMYDNECRPDSDSECKPACSKGDVKEDSKHCSESRAEVLGSVCDENDEWHENQVVQSCGSDKLCLQAGKDASCLQKCDIPNAKRNYDCYNYFTKSYELCKEGVWQNSKERCVDPTPDCSGGRCTKLVRPSVKEVLDALDHISINPDVLPILKEWVLA